MTTSYRPLVVLASVLCAVTLFAQSAPTKALNITGKWTMTLVMEIGTGTPALEFKQDGEKITGTYTGRYGTVALVGTLKGRALAFALTVNAEGQPAEMRFTGEVAADAQSM